MTDLLVLDLVDKNVKTDQMVITVGYDIDNLKRTLRERNFPERYRQICMGERYRKVPMER